MIKTNLIIFYVLYTVLNIIKLVDYIFGQLLFDIKGQRNEKVTFLG